MKDYDGGSQDHVQPRSISMFSQVMVGKLHEYPRRLAFSDATHTIFGQGSRFTKWLCHGAGGTIARFFILFVTGEVLRRCPVGWVLCEGQG